MRQLDENKRKKIAEAAIRLIVTEGFAATSMHKIAKEAKVAASTIYLYFENKEDMLIKVYLMVKRDFSDHMLRGFQADMPIREGVKLLALNMAGYFQENPLNGSFMDQFENSALIPPVYREQAMVHFQPAIILVERGIKEKVLKDVSCMLIGAFILYPMVNQVKKANREGTKVSKKEMEQMFELVWDAIRV